MASFVLSFFPLDVLDEIWDLIESVSEDFLPTLILDTCICIENKTSSSYFCDVCYIILLLVITTTKKVKIFGFCFCSYDEYDK